MLRLDAARAAQPPRRVRPGEPGWPTSADWARLKQQVDGYLIRPESPLDVCRESPDNPACVALFRELKNPYFIGDSPVLTQTCEWVGAWKAAPGAYVVAARRVEHVAAAVNFARERNLRVVVRGGGHSYLGTSNAPDSLMIWTRAMNDISNHDAFVPSGCAGVIPPGPAVSVGAGAIWMHTYEAVTGGAGRYVQGGGCATVGVAGLIQGGGFGTHSKQFGIASASLLEAEVVTADGVVRVVNARTEPDLFWALKGGGGGTFGVVSRLTLRTHELPAVFGLVSCAVVARSDAGYKRLLDRFVAFYADNLCNRHWGELVKLLPGNRLRIDMSFQGLGKEEVATLWKPFWEWIGSQDDLTMMAAPSIIAGPGRLRWDGAALARFVPGSVLFDDRPGAPDANFFWAANLAEAGHVIHGFDSLWLPAAMLARERQAELVDALMGATRYWLVELHFQKGLAGAPAEVIAAGLQTPVNPVVAESFALAIVASEGPPAFDGLTGREPDVSKAQRDARLIGLAIDELRKIAPAHGAYVAESSYFQKDWQTAYWGANYARLLSIKRRYDPQGVFFVRHGVGSEGWSDDGFTRVADSG
ncbi:FAD-dependent oxidoreductase [Paraburkholderia sp. HD33-4]|uniref:FAD-dependent oxidoreductase n=1 Tax=Paraburkholderia sp. HD33-4 TaxID=2883242 RepID=UPI001F47DECA|nr:FAD-binding oxidoreductase [Paraburkholderia sp. HD33-4]